MDRGTSTQIDRGIELLKIGEIDDGRDDTREVARGVRQSLRQNDAPTILRARNHRLAHEGDMCFAILLSDQIRAFGNDQVGRRRTP